MTTPAPVFRAARRPRTPLTVDLIDGSIQAGGHQARFDPAEQDAAELAYLKLVRRMRDVHREPSFVLRSDDVEALASALDEDPVTVLERLGALMGATVTQRRSMVTAFLAGALLIVVATSAVAVGSDNSPSTSPSDAGDDRQVDAEVVAPPAAGDTGSLRTGSLRTGSLDSDPRDAPASDGDTGPGDATGPAAADGPAAPDARPGAEASAPGAPAPVRSRVAPGPAGGPADDPRSSTDDRAPTADRAPNAGRGPSSPAPAPAPDPSPAPPVAGEPDAWHWGQPRVDQPGAVIDLPPDPDDGEPATDPPADEGPISEDPIGEDPIEEGPADEVAGDAA
jgi:hypothetical protein